MRFRIRNLYVYLFRLVICGEAYKGLSSKVRNESDFNLRLKKLGIFRDVIDSLVFGCLTHTREERVFLDVGANIGEFGKRVEHYYKKDVLYIEANPAVFQNLVNNINDEKKAINIAISDRNTSQVFSYFPSHTGGGRIGLPRSVDEKTVSVLCLTLDSLFERFNLKAVCGIKIDVEGHELKVMEGSEMIIRNFRPLFCIELTKSSDFAKLKSMLPEYKFYYLNVPGLDFSSSFVIRLWGLLKTLIFKRGYFLEYDNKKEFVSGLMCVPKENNKECLDRLSMFFKNDLDVLS
jgi:FkbM family methyltransferase